MSIKSMLRNFLLFFILAVGLSGIPGCGGASPPAGIPAPVSHLLSVGNPDALGNVTVTGATGAVNPGATVSGSNLNPLTLRFLDKLFLGKALAETGAFSDTTIAGPDGSFQLKLTARVGNILRVNQIVDKQISPPTDLTVSGNILVIGDELRGLEIDLKTHVAFVSARQSSNGLIFSIPLSDPASLTSFPDAAFLFENDGGIGDVGIDADLNEGFAVSATDNSLVRFPVLADNNLSNQNIVSPLIIDVLDSAHLAVIGLSDTSKSILFYDTQAGGPICSFLLTHPNDPTLTHLATPLAEILQDANGLIEVIALSQYQDGSWVASRNVFTSCSRGLATPSQIVLPSGVTPNGLAAYNDGGNVLVSDVTGKKVLEIDFNQNIMSSSISVGNNPNGIAISPQTHHAYVVNSGDNSVTSIDLNTLATTTHNDVGLSPSLIRVDPNLNLAVVLSTFDQSVVLVPLDF